MTSGVTLSLIEADLHGLVDGQIDPSRRANALRRLAASPADRARVESWQAQNDLLRSAFAGIDREPVPAALRLSSRPQLHCIPAQEPPLVESRPARSVSGRARFGTFAALIVVAAGLFGSWTLLNDDGSTDEAASGVKLRGTVDATLASRSSQAISKPVGAPQRIAASLPTTEIPDLHAAGFSFIGAETASQPPSIQFRYQNGAAERIVLSVARADGPNDAGAEPTRIGMAFSWHKGDNAYAIAGTMRVGKLHTIAAALQQE